MNGITNSQGQPLSHQPALAGMLHSMRIVHADFALLHCTATHGFTLVNRNSVMLHLVLEGCVAFNFTDIDDLVSVPAGHYIFTPSGVLNNFGPEGAQHFTPLFPLGSSLTEDRPASIHAHTSPPVATILSAAIDIDSARHEALLRLMPEFRVWRRKQGTIVFDARPLLNPSGIIQISTESGSPAILRGISEALLAHGTRARLQPGNNPAAGIATADAPQLAIALRLMYEQPERGWSVAALAREAGMSRTVFAAAFRARLGETPIDHLASVRMRRAKELLRNSNRILPEIAHLCGYESEAAFARAFKRRAGVSPGRWRRGLVDR